MNVCNLYSFVLYNCNGAGHTSRDCPEPKKNTRGGRGDFNFGANDRNNGFRKTENTFRNLNNPNSSNRDNSNESKPTFTGRRGGLTNAMNNNNSNSIVKRTTFSNPSTRGSSTNTGGEFRGNELKTNAKVLAQILSSTVK